MESQVVILFLYFLFLLAHSGKPFSAVLHNKLKCQVLENPWVTPGHFTQAPSLECVFAQCYAIKSWLDLRQDHISILHCSNGRSRTGILMACFLKYIGAFEHASDAFDFFCGARSELVNYCRLITSQSSPRLPTLAVSFLSDII